MIVRVIWWIALAALGLVAGAAQLDREARFSPLYSLKVPQAFRGFSQFHIARLAIAGDNSQVARDEARRLIRVRPMPAEHLSVLAMAASANDDIDTTLRALEAAATRGWRDPISQKAVIEAAITDGNYEQAAQRLVAMWSLGLIDEPLRSNTSRMFETAEGRIAFSQAMPVSKRWRRNFEARNKSTIAPERLQAMLEGSEEGILDAGEAE